LDRERGFAHHGLAAREDVSRTGQKPEGGGRVTKKKTWVSREQGREKRFADYQNKITGIGNRPHVTRRWRLRKQNWTVKIVGETKRGWGARPRNHW